MQEDVEKEGVEGQRKQKLGEKMVKVDKNRCDRIWRIITII